MLVCPIPLPSDHNLYDIQWKQIVDSVSVQVTNDSESGFMLSADNTRLFVLLSNSTDERIFRCKINLQRCSIIRLCAEKFIVMGPFMDIRVLGKL